MANATMGTMSSMRCDAQTTRRIVERETGQMKNMDLDKLDNCGEVTLGLSATFGCTFAIWILGLNFFDMAVLGWIRSWEPIQFDTFKAPILDSFPAASKGTPGGAFTAMDVDRDGYASKQELRTFLEGLKNPNLKPGEVNYAFHGLDVDEDGKVSESEWSKAFVHNTFFWHDTTTTTTTTAMTTLKSIEVKPAAKVQPANQDQVRKGIAALMHELDGQKGAESAFKDLDLNNDGFSAHGEMIEAMKNLPPPSGVSSNDLFHGMDLNEDGVLELPEFKKVFDEATKGNQHTKSNENEGKDEKEVVHVKVGQPQKTQHSGRVAQVLKELNLKEPPLTLSRFAHGMGSVPPETAFKALDSNEDNEISEAEMVRFAKAFVPPLIETQAVYAHRGMDINDDGRVVPAEMYDTLRFGEFFPTEEQAREMHQ